MPDMPSVPPQGSAPALPPDCSTLSPYPPVTKSDLWLADLLLASGAIFLVGSLLFVQPVPGTSNSWRSFFALRSYACISVVVVFACLYTSLVPHKGIAALWLVDVGHGLSYTAMYIFLTEKSAHLRKRKRGRVGFLISWTRRGNRWRPTLRSSLRLLNYIGILASLVLAILGPFLAVHARCGGYWVIVKPWDKLPGLALSCGMLVTLSAAFLLDLRHTLETSGREDFLAEAALCSSSTQEALRTSALSLAIVNLVACIISTATNCLLFRIFLIQPAFAYSADAVVTPYSIIYVDCIINAVSMVFSIRYVNIFTRLQRPSVESKRLRLKTNHQPVTLPPATEGGFHIFLSHVWGTGQDQMRVVKQRLAELLPDARVFLDVDDLTAIGDLEDIITSSSTVLVFCTRGYFSSRNCMRELVAAASQRKPIIALVETEVSHGALTTAQVYDELQAVGGLYAKWGFEADAPRGEALYKQLFATEPIEWNRTNHFQVVTTRLIAERLLPGGFGSTRDSTYVDSELSSQRHKPLKTPREEHHVYCSPLNHGALALMEEVAQERGFTLLVDQAKERNTRQDLHVSSKRQNLPACDQMLLYLTSLTWTSGAASVALGKELDEALDRGVVVLLAHEMPGAGGQEVRHGVDFDSFFSCPDGSTPEPLLRRGIYSLLAVALKGGRLREASLAELGRAITKGGGSEERSERQSAFSRQRSVTDLSLEISSDFAACTVV